MKTTKKGFTLIELIVVIAIIGVLAAILVPTMLGYVRKSKISSANSAASSVYKAINSAITELDEEGIDVGGLYLIKWDGSKWTCDQDNLATAGVISQQNNKASRFEGKVANFFSDIKKVKQGYAAIKGGSCIAFAGATDSTYTGTYPGGIVTTDTYEAYSNAAGANGALGTGIKYALEDAIKVAAGNKTKGAGDKTVKGRMQFDTTDVGEYTATSEYKKLGDKAQGGTTGSAITTTQG